MANNEILLYSPEGIFRCLKCMSHIASSANYYLRDTPDGEERALGFNEIVNVVTATEESLFLHTKYDEVTSLVTTYEVKCAHCLTPLGWRLADEEVDAAAEGRFVLRRDKLEEVGDKSKGKGIKIEEDVGGEDGEERLDQAERERRSRLRIRDNP